MIEWPAMALALAGAYLVAEPPGWRLRLGWCSFFASNLLWIAHASEVGEVALLWMQAAFLFTSARGLWRSCA